MRLSAANLAMYAAATTTHPRPTPALSRCYITPTKEPKKLQVKTTALLGRVAAGRRPARRTACTGTVYATCHFTRGDKQKAHHTVRRAVILQEGSCRLSFGRCVMGNGEWGTISMVRFSTFQNWSGSLEGEGNAVGTHPQMQASGLRCVIRRNRCGAAVVAFHLAKFLGIDSCCALCLAWYFFVWADT